MAFGGWDTGRNAGQPQDNRGTTLRIARGNHRTTQPERGNHRGVGSKLKRGPSLRGLSGFLNRRPFDTEALEGPSLRVESW